MENIVLTQLSIREIRQIFRDEIHTYFARNQRAADLIDETGKGAQFASKITGKAVSTIYDLVHKGSIPYSKRGKDLYFSRAELMNWLMEAKDATRNSCRSAESKTGQESKTREKRRSNRFI